MDTMVRKEKRGGTIASCQPANVTSHRPKLVATPLASICGHYAGNVSSDLDHDVAPGILTSIRSLPRWWNIPSRKRGGVPARHSSLLLARCLVLSLKAH